MKAWLYILVFLWPLVSIGQTGTDPAVEAFNRGDYETAHRAWRARAEQGDASAQFNLGIIWDNGLGVSEDDTEAFRWYRLAAQNGNADAQYSLGRLYYLGKVVPQDFSEALRWYRLAAQNGNADAEKLLSTMASSSTSASASSQSASDRIAFEGAKGAVVGVTLGLLGGLFWLTVHFVKRAKRAAEPKVREIASKSKTAIANISKSKEERLLAIDDKYFAAASDEILQGTQVRGLWAKALALAEGDEKKQKAIYVRLRAKQMSD